MVELPTMGKLSTDSKLSDPSHPFYPLGVEVGVYLANRWDTLTLLSIFAVGCAIILGMTWTMFSRSLPQLRRNDKLAILWFILSGSIHLFFEGYFSLNHTRMAGAGDLFGQWWKEYAMSDSRYLTSDPFVLCMETVTAFAWGPLSYVTAYMIAVRHPLRFPLQAVVSLGQIYGDVLYYATCMFDHYHKNITYCRPEAYYFWFYFFFMNFIWIVIPGLLLYQSMQSTAKAFRALDNMSTSLQANGGFEKSPSNGAVKKPHANGQTKKKA